MKNKPTRASKQFAKDVSNRIHEQRIKSNFSQESLATKCGVDRKTINRIENGHFSPSMETFIRICGALGVKPSKMIGGK